MNEEDKEWESTRNPDYIRGLEDGIELALDKITESDIKDLKQAQEKLNGILGEVHTFRWIRTEENFYFIEEILEREMRREGLLQTTASKSTQKIDESSQQANISALPPQS